MKRLRWILPLTLLASIYLFVSAPPPLPEESDRYGSGPAKIPVASLLTELNAINTKAREIYTSRIVSVGKKAGLKFSEEWANEGMQAGPLPALFLRLTSAKLSERKSPAGLFLGSDQPINKSNYFKGKQVKEFELLKADRQPRFFEMKKLGLHLGMFADIASASGCVSCHNKHQDSPKKDWRLHDVMGATTWTYPRPFVTTAEARAVVADLYIAIRSAYDDYLAKAGAFTPAVNIASEWPADGKLALPDCETFMHTLMQATATEAISFAFLQSADFNEPKKPE